MRNTSMGKKISGQVKETLSLPQNTEFKTV